MFYNIKNTRNASLSNRVFFLIGVLVSSLFITGNVFAQTTQPTPDKVEVGGYKVTSSMEFGVRGKHIESGSDVKFNSDYNYRAGFRIFNSSFRMENKEGKGKGKAFDSLMVNSSGWGADPTGYVRLNVEKLGAYRFTTNVRKVSYFNQLNNYAAGEHRHNAKNNLGDFDLTLLPQNEKLRINLGYSYSRFTGPGNWTARPNSDEFMVESDNNVKSNDFRIGIETQLAGFNMGFTQGFRYYHDKTRLNWFNYNVGNNNTTFYNNAGFGIVNMTTGYLDYYTKDMPMDGKNYYSMFNVQRTFAKKLDFAAKVVYSKINVDNSVLEVAKGRDTSNPPYNIISDTYSLVGTVSRPQTKADVGFTFRVTDKFTVSDTMTFDRFAINGSTDSTRTLLRNLVTTGAAANTLTLAQYYRVDIDRHFMNALEGDYQFSNKISGHLGYRVLGRKTEESGYDKASLSSLPLIPQMTTTVSETSTTDTIFGGMKIKPMKHWVMFWDAERGKTDQTFTKFANYNVFNARIRNRFTFEKVSLGLNAVWKDNVNPNQTDLLGTNYGVNVKSRTYSGVFDWNPIPEFSINSGYTYTHLTSFGIAIVSITRAIAPTAWRVPDYTLYLVRDHNAYFDVVTRPHKNVSLYASYRVSKDTGQGDRVAPTAFDYVNNVYPNKLLGSYPYTLVSPEFRVAFRITKNIDWNLGYQYFNYKEKFQTSQNYIVHTPYTSLTIYFGGADR